MNFEPLDITRRAETTDVKKVMNMHHEIVRLMVLGYKDVDIARTLDCTPATIRNVRKNPIIQQRLREMNLERDKSAVEMGSRLREIAVDAVDVIEEAINDDSLSLSVRADKGFKVLDRIGFGPVHNIKGQVNHALFTREDIEDIKRRAREAMIPAKIGEV